MRTGCLSVLEDFPGTFSVSSHNVSFSPRMSLDKQWMDGAGDLRVGFIWDNDEKWSLETYQTT